MHVFFCYSIFRIGKCFYLSNYRIYKCFGFWEKWFGCEYSYPSKWGNKIISCVNYYDPISIKGFKIGWMRKWPGRTVQRRAISKCHMEYYDTIFATGRYIAFLFEFSYFGDMFLWIMTLYYHTGWSTCDSTSVGEWSQFKLS